MKKVINYVKENKLFVTFVICNLITTSVLRFLTVKNYFNLRPILVDLGLLIILGSFSYNFKDKKKFIYLFSLTIIFSLICFINSMYYSNYLSYASVSLIGSLAFLKDVGNAVVDNILEVKDFLFLIPIPLFFFLNYKEKYEKNHFKKTIYSGILFLVLAAPFYSGKDYSRLWKQWNREHIVMQFGIILYHLDDFVVSIKPGLVNLFGADTALKNFREYYDNVSVKKENEYTGIFEGKNVLIIHAESIQDFVINTKINGKEITPNLNKLINKSLYFNNFYAQDSVGTSSDTEFTFSTSLLPTNNGTVFLNYWNRKYETIEQKFDDLGYFTFSMHANNGAFWNRNVMYNTLGYQKFYNYENDYILDDMIGLGLSDKSFFKQSIQILKKIQNSNQNYFGKLITLTNHTPFTHNGEDLSDFDVSSSHYDYYKGTVKDDYLEGSALGSYIKSVHYADMALGEFVNSLEKEKLLENTVLVIYGDHDAKLKKSQFEYYYNYDRKTGKVLDESDEDYKAIDDIDFELLRKVPLIIYSDDLKPETIDEVMSMMDVMPTLANMFNIKTTYNLGNDIFDEKENIVVFPNGNWLTNKIYYDAKKEEWKALEDNLIVSNEYISSNTLYAETIVSISNDLIMYDLIKKSEENEEILKKN